MGKGYNHANIPGYVKLGQFMDRYLLEELQRLAWMMTAPEEKLKPNVKDQILALREAYSAIIPAEGYRERIDAIKEIGLIAQRAASGL